MEESGLIQELRPGGHTAKKSGYSVEQIAYALKPAEPDSLAGKVCRRMEIGDATVYIYALPQSQVDCVFWSGGWLIAVPPHHTNLNFPCCQHGSPDNRRARAKLLYIEPERGYEHHADVVSAINILARGQRVAA